MLSVFLPSFLELDWFGGEPNLKYIKKNKQQTRIRVLFRIALVFKGFIGEEEED